MGPSVGRKSGTALCFYRKFRVFVSILPGNFSPTLTLPLPTKDVVIKTCKVNIACPSCLRTFTHRRWAHCLGATDDFLPLAQSIYQPAPAYSQKRTIRHFTHYLLLSLVVKRPPPPEEIGSGVEMMMNMSILCSVRSLVKNEAIYQV